MKQLSEKAVVRTFAENICQRLTSKVIASLQKMTDGLLSGDGSGLKNTWDELCVQVQFEKSVFWKTYRSEIESILASRLEELAAHEVEAIWLQTPEAADWENGDESKRDPYPVRNDDVIRFLFDVYLCSKAGQWRNSRIRFYLDLVKGTNIRS